MLWFIFNEQGEIISDGFSSEAESIEAMRSGNYDTSEVPDDVDGLDID